MLRILAKRKQSRATEFKFVLLRNMQFLLVLLKKPEENEFVVIINNFNRFQYFDYLSGDK